ncbi:MAG: hypothetical protein JRN08_10040 [Nitrososphaerota archaeon]|nr:hypothetical protein [Nitrososphaerota archaeon]
MLVLSGVALSSGGVASPAAFLAGGMVVLLWPVLRPMLPFSEVAPVGDSILLKSKYSPVDWCALAELKPGAEAFPRAISSFRGTLLVFTDTGKAYALARCRSLSRKEAEERVLSKFRSSAPGTGAYVLPLDGEVAADVFRLKLSRTKLPSGDLAESAPSVSGLLVLDCDGRSIRSGAAFRVEGASPSSTLPGRGTGLESAPLTWEVLEAIGKRTRWPDPDSLSDLLDSMTATRGVPVAERIRTLEGSGAQVTVHSLTGEEVHVSRPQLRAILSIYS